MNFNIAFISFHYFLFYIFGKFYKLIKIDTNNSKELVELITYNLNQIVIEPTLFTLEI